MSLEICLIVFVFFLVFNLVQGPLGSRTFLLLFLSLPFRGIRVGTPTNLDGGSGSDRKIWSRSSLVLKYILVGTELILLCGPRYFGIFRERTRLCVDGEDGIG